MSSPRRWFLPLVLLLALAAAPACVDDVEPGDEAPALDAAVGELGFLAACTSHEECASGLCFNFNAKGLHCTHACQSATDCEAPSPGCSGMNVCKTP